MPVWRPTFHESWHRVAGLRPRLRSTVQVQRQRFRGRPWYVVRDATGNDFFRLSNPAYHFVGLLDGERSVAQAWRACNDVLGEGAPTQGEAIQLLGMMHNSNLLVVEESDDAGVLLRQYRHKSAMRVRGHLSSLLMARIPLFDPDSFLNRWKFLFSWLFTPWGAALWLLIVGVGLITLVNSGMDPSSRAAGILSPANLPLLYVAIIGTKVLHELGHAFACKALGDRCGVGGEVHTIGIMLILFMPVPYVDVTSAWSLPRKRQRMVVAAAGMLVELAVAAVAAIIWTHTTAATTVHIICFNVMLVAGIATVLFNGNPLMRYDGYFILADLLEIPNLAQRGWEYVQYLVKRHAWGIEGVQSPAHAESERKWLLGYALAAAAYRAVICPWILLVVMDHFFIVGAVLATSALTVWLVLPCARFIRYLFTSPELARCRRRALSVSLAGGAGALAVLGFLPAPDSAFADGIVEAGRVAEIHAAMDGFAEECTPSGTVVEAGSVLLTMRNAELTASRASLGCTTRLAHIRRQIAVRDRDVVGAQTVEAWIESLARQALRIEQDIEALTLRAPCGGTWVAGDSDRVAGRYLRRGDPVGTVASLDQVIIRATAEQTVAGQLFAETRIRTHVRLPGQPESEFDGLIKEILPAGQDRLPSPALGQPAGGSIAVNPTDSSGTKSAEPFFEIRIRPEALVRLLPGQRVQVRFTLTAKPLGRQCWQAFWRIWQRRVHT
ncbi:MAG: hypothetical protein AABZ12_05510, partial [Planctomycetota bacterium]